MKYFAWILSLVIVALLSFFGGASFMIVNDTPKCYLQRVPNSTSKCVIDRNIQIWNGDSKGMTIPQGFPIELGVP